MRGLFIGRFQPLHLGHMSIIEHALGEVKTLIIGVGSAEKSFLPEDPFSAGERIEMILRTAESRGLEDRIIPIPIRDINRYSVWVDHVVSICPPFDVVYANNPLTRTLFSERGIEVRSTPLVDRTKLSGVKIRKWIAEGDSWRILVPDSVEEVMEEVDGVRRIKDIHGEADE